MSHPQPRNLASILVHVDLAASTARRVALARALADRFKARLIGVAAEEPATAFDRETLVYVSQAVAEEEALRVSADLARAAGVFHAAAGPGDRVAWQVGEANPTRHLLAQSRSADLAVVGRQAEEDELDWRMGVSPGDVVMTLGRPMLLVPPSLGALEAQRVIVAWKDSREARRAVIDGLPFLQRAESVFVVAVGDGSGGAEDVAAYLAQQGVKAPRTVPVRQTASVFAHLLEVADGEGADLIVAGAFGHSRVREWVLGGVTQEMLETSPACCLLSH
jgi:nucleotide-binding universal stress UspA family protein